MKFELRPVDSRVLSDGCDLLHRHEVRTFTGNAFTKRQRRGLKAHGVDPIGDLDENGTMQYALQAAHTKKRLLGRNPVVVVRGSVVRGKFYALTCEGELAEEVVNRVNAVLKPKILKRIERRQRQAQFAAKKRRDLEKRRKREEARKLRHKDAPRKQSKAARPVIPAPLTLELNVRDNIRVTRIFKKSRYVTYHEAVRAVGRIFQVKATQLITTQERVDFRLRRSLERTGLRFAMWKKDGFTLRFDLVTNWRGDITKLRISCSNDNTHPLYRRTRDHFRGILQGQSNEQEDGRRRLQASLEEDVIKIAA